MEQKIKQHIQNVRCMMFDDWDFKYEYVESIDFHEYASYLRDDKSIMAVKTLRGLGLDLLVAIDCHKQWVWLRESL